EDCNQAWLNAMQLGRGPADAPNTRDGSPLRAARLYAALVRADEAVRRDPGNAQAQYELGNALFNAGHIAEAIQQYGQALRLAPRLAEAHHNLAVALVREGRTAEAIEHDEQAARLR